LFFPFFFNYAWIDRSYEKKRKTKNPTITRYRNLPKRRTDSDRNI
jgi:hypothetical protein